MNQNVSHLWIEKQFFYDAHSPPNNSQIKYNSSGNHRCQPEVMAPIIPVLEDTKTEGPGIQEHPSLYN